MRDEKHCWKPVQDHEKENQQQSKRNKNKSKPTRHNKQAQRKKYLTNHP